MSDDPERECCKPVGRGPKVCAAVMDATLAELADHGYAALTIDGVARRAGVHKTTVYRRWGDRHRLVLDAITDHVSTEIPVPDTGSAEGDLRALARGLVAWVVSPEGSAMLSTMLCDGGDEAIAEARRAFHRSRFEQATPIVRRAIERGELPASADPIEVVEALMAPLFLRLLVTAAPLDDDVADRAADIALTAARAGVLSARTRAGR
jgi:AcrR family transcriptional regulator